MKIDNVDKLIKETESLQKQAFDQFTNLIKTFPFFAALEKGKIYKFTIRHIFEKEDKIIYGIYDGPKLYGNIDSPEIKYIPLNKKLEPYSGRRGYTQTEYIKYIKEIELIEK